MQFASVRRLLPFAMAISLGCGARSPLELTDDVGGGGSSFPTGGGAQGEGGDPAGGGGLGAGGMTGASGGASAMGAAGGRAGGGAAGGLAGLWGGGGFVAGGDGGRFIVGGIPAGAGGRGGTAGAAAGRGGGGRRPGGAGGGAGAQGGPRGGAGALGGTTGESATGGAGGLQSTGGTGGATRGGTGGSTCPGLAGNEELIDDFSDGDRFLPKLNGRVGSWSVTHDDTPGGVMSPEPSAGFAPAQTGETCRGYAAYVKGYGFSDWGATLGVGLGSPYPAGAFVGISFLAKIDPGSKEVLRVAFPDKDTDPDGGLCRTNTTGPDACFDHYGKRVALTSQWTRHTIFFLELTQDGWGRQGATFDADSLYGIVFQVPEGAGFGLWLDDVAFVYHVDPI